MICRQVHYVVYSMTIKLQHMSVGMVKAIHISPEDFSRTSDFYIKVYLLSDQRQKYQSKSYTVYKWTTCTCVFGVPYKELSSRNLHFNTSIYDFDSFLSYYLIRIGSFWYKARGKPISSWSLLCPKYFVI